MSNNTSSVSEILNNTKSKIDNRSLNKLNQSIIDQYTSKLRVTLRDRTLGEGMVAKALIKLGEAKVNNIAEYAARKADNPGRAFVKICYNVMGGGQ